MSEKTEDKGGGKPRPYNFHPVGAGLASALLKSIRPAEIYPPC